MAAMHLSMAFSNPCPSFLNRRVEADQYDFDVPRRNFQSEFPLRTSDTRMPRACASQQAPLSVDTMPSMFASKPAVSSQLPNLGLSTGFPSVKLFPCVSPSQ